MTTQPSDIRAWLALPTTSTGDRIIGLKALEDGRDSLAWAYVEQELAAARA